VPPPPLSRPRPTALVMTRSRARAPLAPPHGQVATGILLFQDFLIVPFLLLVPVLAGVAATTGREILWRFGGGLLVVAVVFGLGRLLLPPVLKLVVRTEIRELLVIGSLLACLGGALVTEALGFSLALGAFLAGILLSESEYHHQVVAETGPFRDVFNSVFFISVGMLVELDLAAARLPEVLGLSGAILVLKGAVVFLVAWLLGFPLRTRLLAALALSQIGELSLLLARGGHRDALLSDDAYQILLAVAVLTMLVTPAFIALGPRLVDRLPGGGAGEPETGGGDDGRAGVVVAGFGLNGRNLARVLGAAGAPYRVVDADGRKVRMGRAAGEPMLFGDATRPEILRRAGVETAQVAVFALSDPRASLTAVRAARELNPSLFVIARTRRVADIEALRQAGADEVVAEEFETSLEIVTLVLRRLHVPGNVIRAQTRLLRADGYQMLRTPPPGELSEPLRRALAAGTTDSFQLAPEHAAVGSTLRGLDLRDRTGVTALAVIRGDQPVAGSIADLELADGDLLVLVGGHVQIDAAFRLLASGEA
ncbi:MAG: cation:proton antiporter, partial [Thermoanaerobaculia bacterium]|nr:cation:proton antiporter [Thermoanaerobaculia bacterium]